MENPAEPLLAETGEIGGDWRKGRSDTRSSDGRLRSAFRISFCKRERAKAGGLWPGGYFGLRVTQTSRSNLDEGRAGQAVASRSSSAIMTGASGIGST